MITFLACCAHYPGGPIRAAGCRFDALPRRVLPDRFRLPRFSAGSAPHWVFRGLLELYTRYGLPSCSPTFRGLCHEVPARPVSRPNRPPAIESNHQVFEWVLPPLVICPFRAHAEACPTKAGLRAGQAGPRVENSIDLHHGLEELRRQRNAGCLETIVEFRADAGGAEAPFDAPGFADAGFLEQE